MGIDQLTFVKSCRQLGRWVILSLCEYYNLFRQVAFIDGNPYLELTYPIKNIKRGFAVFDHDFWLVFLNFTNLFSKNLLLLKTLKSENKMFS